MFLLVVLAKIKFFINLLGSRSKEKLKWRKNLVAILKLPAASCRTCGECARCSSSKGFLVGVKARKCVFPITERDL